MQATNHCPTCGFLVNWGATFCRNCGSQLCTPTPVQNQQFTPVNQQSAAYTYNAGTQSIAGRRISITWSGSGGDLIWKLLGWIILTVITLGIYYPWFICNLMRYLVENTTANTP